MEQKDSNTRYQKQILLKELGEDGQQKLMRSKVVVIGAGGLGCPALLYLAAAGIGTIGIVDIDVIEMSNLHRQVLYTVGDIGKYKAVIAAQKLKAINPDINVVVYNTKIENENAFDIIAPYDLVIDGSDNYPTRYMINDACVLLDKPLVYGAVSRFEGQVGVFNLADPVSKVKSNYRDLFPNPPDNGYTHSCNEAGVLGVLPGIIGTMQATETIKIITGIGSILHNSMITYNALENSFFQFIIPYNEEAQRTIPKNKLSFLKYNYEQHCNSMHHLEITVRDFDILRSTDGLTIVDVRERNELPVVNDFVFKKMPFSEFEKGIEAINKENKVILFCQTGSRSLQAAELLKNKFPLTETLSLKGGIEAWKNYKIRNNE